MSFTSTSSAPACSTRYLARKGFDAQQADEPAPEDAADNLFVPVDGDFGAHGRFEAVARTTSWALRLRLAAEVLAHLLVPNRPKEARVKKLASELLVERLIDWGVDVVFGLPGDGINGIMEGLRRHKDRIRFVLVHHEEAGERSRECLGAAAVGYAFAQRNL